MKLTVLYFAAVRDLVNVEEEIVETSARTIAELRSDLEKRHPALVDRLSSVRFARNEQFATDGESLHDGDVVALIPPVAGG